MKAILKICLLLLLGSPLWGQADGDNLPKNELGFNINAALNYFVFDNTSRLNLNQNVFLHPDYKTLLVYRRFYHPQKALKLGFGYQQHLTRDTVTSGSFFEAVQERKIRFITFHVGLQRNFHLQKRLVFFTGINWLYENEVQTVNSEETFINTFPAQTITFKNSVVKNNFGIGIPLGIQYYFGKGISVTTEMDIELLGSFSKSKNGNSGNSNSDFSNKTTDTFFRLKSPLSIFLNLRF